MPLDPVTRRATLALPLLALAAPARAQGWPTRPVSVVVPFPPGGTADIVARLVTAGLGSRFGQNFIVENRRGANGTTGTDTVVRASPDGQTLLMSASPTHTINPHLYSRLPHDPLRDTAPVALVAEAPNIIVVNPSLGVSTLAGLVARARAEPGALAYASGGNGSSGHLAIELLKSSAQIDMLHVPYSGGPDAVIDVIGGRVAMTAFTAPAVLPHVAVGRLRALAVTGARRSPLAPDLPTVAETGYPGYQAVAWYGMFGPAALPAEITTRLESAIGTMLEEQALRDALLRAGAEPRFLGARDFAAFLREDSARWAEVVSRSGARVD